MRRSRFTTGVIVVPVSGIADKNYGQRKVGKSLDDSKLIFGRLYDAYPKKIFFHTVAVTEQAVWGRVRKAGINSGQNAQYGTPFRDKWPQEGFFSGRFKDDSIA